MKKFYLLLLVLILAIGQTFAARVAPANGRVVDEKGAPVEYATVVLLKGAQQAAGMATDNQGRFSLKVTEGEYTLSIQYLGLEPLSLPVSVRNDTDLGNFVLKASATQIEGVEVKAQLIRREADRFVVDVANTPAAIGRDGIELLENSPGVWIDGEKITINGKSGSKVYINDWELRMEPAQLLAYLRALRAEEIQKIEIVPIVGADYDASASGGAIRIVLRKRRENGLNGSLSLRTEQGNLINRTAPNANINIHSGRTDFFASVRGLFGDSKTITDEQTRYHLQDANLQSHSDMKHKIRNYGLSAGTVVEINARHSVGAEVEFWHDGEPQDNISYTDFISDGALTRTDSRFKQSCERKNISATFNYIYKLDTLGSTLKFLTDYTRRTGDNKDDNFSRTTAAQSRDSLYRDNTANRYNVFTATLALEKRLSAAWGLKAGIKYTYNDMRNTALYEYLKEEVWVKNASQSFAVNYTENIAAAYAIATFKHKRLSAVAGLRGEYTRTYGKGSDVKQNYFSLFPNVNLSYALSKDGAYSLIAQYARTISRPSFWTLSPERTVVSDYTYQTGNPALEPAFKDDISMTFVFKHKYSLTGGIYLQTHEIQQTIIPDTEDPDKLNLTWVNFDRSKAYYLTANLPFQLTKWWSLNVNATYWRSGQRVEQHGEEKFYNFCFLHGSTTFTLPAKFYIDLAFGFQSNLNIGSVWVKQQSRLEAGIKKHFGDRFTVSFSVKNLLNTHQVIGADGNGFTREVNIRDYWNSRIYRIGVTYNFKSGKAFKSKSVEAGSAEEKSRL